MPTRCRTWNDTTSSFPIPCKIIMCISQQCNGRCFKKAFRQQAMQSCFHTMGAFFLITLLFSFLSRNEKSNRDYIFSQPVARFFFIWYVLAKATVNDSTIFKDTDWQSDCMSAQVSQKNRPEGYDAKCSLWSQNPRNMFCKITQSFISIGSLVGLFLNICADDSSAKWDTIFANSNELLIKKPVSNHAWPIPDFCHKPLQTKNKVVNSPKRKTMLS